MWQGFERERGWDMGFGIWDMGWMTQRVMGTGSVGWSRGVGLSERFQLSVVLQLPADTERGAVTVGRD
jgi:hypothetical protein